MINVIWTLLISLHSLLRGTLNADRLDVTLVGDGEKMTFIFSGVVASSECHAFKWSEAGKVYYVSNPNEALKDFDRVHTGAMVKLARLLTFLRTNDMRYYGGVVDFSEDTPRFGNYEIYTFEI